jgi:hypothetical protein
MMNLQCMITKAARMLNSDSLDREGGGKGIAMSACQSSDEPKRNKESNLSKSKQHKQLQQHCNILHHSLPSYL